MKTKFFLFTMCVFAPSFFTSCTTTENVTSAEVKNAREIILDDNIYTAEIIESLGGITSWICMDWYKSSGDKVLLEIGYFTEIPTWGFILYDGTNEGTEKGVWHHREGLEHRWDWGADENGDYRYSFIINPDGTGKYYHFLEGETTTKANSLYRTRKRE